MIECKYIRKHSDSLNLYKGDAHVCNLYTIYIQHFTQLSAIMLISAGFNHKFLHSGDRLL